MTHARLDARLRRLEGADAALFAFVGEGEPLPPGALWAFRDPGESPTVEEWAAEAAAWTEDGGRP